MNAKELAAKLHGSEYPFIVPKHLRVAAKEAGLVIVYGASDDLMEFEGAICDEIGAYHGATAYVDGAGLIPDFQDIDKEGRNAKDELRNYFLREGGGKTITALWDTDGYSWVYKTDIPHETFEIVEDEDLYCRGIVFALADAATEAGQ